ncbi:lithostathine-like [Sphaerodactylus townsendi]|uniref:lithostathine-like n=1 Tax=Sphaerodactylus townsendi TaxID=933632 RepID=UPI002026477E|nr:lithostathine-like [Sphaerodactylus townsendi]
MVLPIRLVSLFYPVVPKDKPQAKSHCPVGTYSYQNNRVWYCFEFYEYRLPFERAEANCQQNRNGGHLASITSETETRLISGYLAGVNRDRAEVWIGLNRHQNSNMKTGWRWTDGSPFLYTNWLAQQPNNSGGKQLCVVLTPGSEFKSWNDATCDQERPFLCEWRAP